MSRKSRRRNSTGQPSDPAPVLLPHVTLTVAEAGTLDVTVDGAPYPPPEGKPWTRAEFGDVLDAVTQGRTVPVRVEVHESDGTVFTDLIRPRRRTASETPQTGAAEPRGKHAKDKLRPGLIEVTAEGFVPGEDVVVAVILTHTKAMGTGTAGASLDQAHLLSVVAGSAAKVVLHGRASGVTHVRRLS